MVELDFSKGLGTLPLTLQVLTKGTFRALFPCGYET